MSFLVGWFGLEDNDNNLERCHQNLTTTLKNCSGNWGNLGQFHFNSSEQIITPPPLALLVSKKSMISEG